MKFRTLAEKSIFGFGSLRDSSVADLLKHGKFYELAVLYYTLSHISFLDPILEKIGIVDEWRIPKPGTDRELGRTFTDTFYKERSIEKQEHYDKWKFKHAKNVLNSLERNNRIKSWHQKFNQKP